MINIPPYRIVRTPRISSIARVGFDASLSYMSPIHIKTNIRGANVSTMIFFTSLLNLFPDDFARNELGFALISYLDPDT